MDYNQLVAAEKLRHAKRLKALKIELKKIQKNCIHQNTYRKIGLKDVYHNWCRDCGKIL